MLNRRTFVQIAAGSLATVLHKPILLAGSDPDRSFEHGAPLGEFPYGQVVFGSCLQQSQLEQSHAILIGLDDDSLLRPYRLRAGLSAPGCNLGGWYSSDEFGAETFGQWISALSRYYAISREEASRAKVSRLLDAFAQTIEPQGKIFGDPKVTGGAAYHYDKLACGLMDAHQCAGYSKAFEILDRATEAVIPQLPGHAVDFLEHDSHETYTIPENQFIVWQRGGDRSHLELARQYLYHSFFEPLANGENVLGDRHAYSHVNSLCSAAKAYLVLGDERHLRAAKNGFAFVEAQSFATGGWGPNEAFLPMKAHPEYGYPARRSLVDTLTQTHFHFETPCGSYAHIKLTRYLLRITRDAHYGDSMERVMYNTVLGAKALLADGRAFYNSDYHMDDGRKFYFEGYYGEIPSGWPCCSGTLPQVAADYRLSSYFYDADGVYVNLYIPSTLRWQQRGTAVSLTQSGSYPLEDTVTFELQLARPTEFVLRLRIPAWAQRPSVYVNGKRISGAEPGTLFAVRRTWRSGDRIELELPKRLELEPVDIDHSNLVAVTYGPLVLFAVSAETPRVTRGQLLAAQRKAPQDSEWSVSTERGTVVLMPFWQIKDQRYSTYLSLV